MVVLKRTASNTANTRDSVSSGYPNTEKRVKNTTRSGVFFMKFDGTLSRVFDTSQSKQKLRNKRGGKIVRRYAKPPSWL